MASIARVIVRRAAELARPAWLAAGLAALLSLQSCGRPNQVNIELRKQIQSLGTEIDQLKQQKTADQARIEGLQQQVKTVPTLPESRLDQLFTTHSVGVGRLTGGADLDPNRPGDEGLRVYVTPLDDAGDPLKATGELTVEAFDLKEPNGLRIGRWEFSPQELKQDWRALGPLHAFVVSCPWQIVPRHADLTVKITFRDALSQRLFTAVREVKVQLPPPPPSTQPSTRASSSSSR